MSYNMRQKGGKACILSCTFKVSLNISIGGVQMDLKYMMLKNRYKFICGPQIALYNLEDNIKREKEISLFLKELALYKISFKLLLKNKPGTLVKNELLNIAYACLEDSYIYDYLRSHRILSLKQVSEFTYKSRRFIEKWQYYITAYMLLLSNDIYRNLRSYLNVEYKDNENETATTSLTAINSTSSKTNTYTGVVLKSVKNISIILTPFGDFVKIKPNKNSILQPGYICTGTLKRDINFYKYPIITLLFFSIILLIASSFVYLKPFRTILVQANSTIKLEVNAWNKVVRVTPLSAYGKNIVESIEIFNVSMDKGIYLILKEAQDKNIVNANTKISIFITGSKNLQTTLPDTETYMMENNLKVQINNNGIEYKINSPLPQGGK
jgi:hypothetical protein